MTVSGQPRVLRRCLNFTRLSSNVVFEELILGSLIASPLMKLFLTLGGWHELKCHPPGVNAIHPVFCAFYFLKCVGWYSCDYRL